MKIKNKRGQIDWYLIISLILGLIILAIAVFWIFQEYFTEESMNWETCRQAVLLRSKMPEKDLIVATLSAKDAFSLKCNTEVINIDYKDTDRAELEFANALVKCWKMIGEGKEKFVASNSLDVETHCIVCARIHLSEDKGIRDYYKANKISFRNALTRQFETSSYWQYLRQDPVALPASKDWQSVNFKVIGEGDTDNPKNIGYSFPENFLVDNGDLLIVVSAPARSEEKISPLLLYLQTKQFSELSKPLASKYGGIIELNPCDYIVSIPA